MQHETCTRITPLLEFKTMRRGHSIGTRRTKAPIMLSDSCDVLRTYIYGVTASEGESNLPLYVLITAAYDTVAILNGCSPRSTKASLSMLSDNCNLIILIAGGDSSCNIEFVQHHKHNGARCSR